MKTAEIDNTTITIATLTLEIEELEKIVAPSGPIGKIATNHNETFLLNDEI